MSNTAPPFRISFELTTDDMVDYLRVAQKRLNSIALAAAVLGMLYGAYLAWLGDVAFGAVLAVMAASLLLVSATRYADRLRAKSIGKRLIGTQATFTIDDGGIDSSTAVGSAHISWGVVDNFMEGAQTIVLRRRRMTLLWLPKRALGEPAEREAALKFIRAHATPAATNQSAR